MPRARARVQTRNRHKKILARTKGHAGRRHRTFKVANESMMHALRYATAHRRRRKGDMRRLWIVRINAAARLHDISYSRLISGLAIAGIQIDRKQLADLAVREPETFGEVASRAKAALAG